MSNSILLLIGTAIAVVDLAVFIYTAYWSLAIRNALAVKLYRRRGLWVGAIATYFVVFFLFIASSRVLGLDDPTYLRYAAGILAYFGALTFFFWIDSTIRVARRSDPLRRDSLHWSRLRWFFGFLIFVGTFFALLFNPTSVTYVQATPLYGPTGGIILIGGIALLRSASRSADLSLRKHLKWFGIFALLTWATTVVEGEIFANHLVPDQAILQTVSYSLFLVSAYSLYRCARSLAPLAPMPLTEENAADSATSA
jgi:hypothetical protein